MNYFEIVNFGLKESNDYLSRFNYEPVDLGLSVKWANKNIGATSIFDSGEYFEFGQIKPKNEFRNLVNIHYKSRSATNVEFTFKEGTRDLMDEYDAVYQNTMHKFRLPTRTEMKELITKTKHKWVENFCESGMNGVIFSGNGNMIFVPAGGGYYFGNRISFFNESAHLWTSGTYGKTINKGCATNFSKHLCAIGAGDRCFGLPVRGVFNF